MGVCYIGSTIKSILLNNMLAIVATSGAVAAYSVQRSADDLLNPITIEDFLEESPVLLDPNNVVCVTFMTHQAIHYSDPSIVIPNIADRKPNDTVPWR